MNPLKRIFPLAQPSDYGTLAVAACYVSLGIFTVWQTAPFLWSLIPAWLTSHLAVFFLGFGIGACFMAVLWPVLVVYFDPGSGKHPGEKGIVRHELTGLPCGPDREDA